MQGSPRRPSRLAPPPTTCLHLDPRTHPHLPQVNGRLRELHTTLEAGDRLREGVLQGMAMNLDAWSIQVGGWVGRALGAGRLEG